jgi:hypothetical protein
MRHKDTGGSLKIWLSASDTENWATRPGAAWPCSTLRGRRVFAEFDPKGDLLDLAIDGDGGEQDCDCNEFNAMMADSQAKICG